MFTDYANIFLVYSMYNYIVSLNYAHLIRSSITTKIKKHIMYNVAYTPMHNTLHETVKQCFL